MSPLPTTWLLPSPQPYAKRRKWGKRRVPFFGPRARGWPACCQQERGNLERFPLRMCQILQWRGSTNKACTCLTRMWCPLLQPQNFKGPCQSVPVLRGPRVRVSDTSRPLCLPDFAWLDFLACRKGKWGQGSHFSCSHILKHTHIHKLPMVPSPTSKLLCILQYPA